MARRFTRIAGIDFSGAEKAGKSIWIAEGTPTETSLTIDNLTRADALPGGSQKRTLALAALRRCLEGQSDLIVGCDFPFSLPKPFLTAKTWQEWLTQTMAAFANADDFREDCRAKSDGREWRRATDQESLTPFSSYNLRLYRQSFWGMTGLLAPLIADGKAVVLPMMQDIPDRLALIETCPASVLKRWNGSQGNVGYKGKTPLEQIRRAEIGSQLTDKGVQLDGNIHAVAIGDKGGDALDALLAAYATWQTSLNPEMLLPRPGSNDALEGRVYF